MRQKSNINSSLTNKRRLSFFKKAGIISLYIVFLISLMVWGLSYNKIQIKSVSVSGNSTVSKDDILKVVDDKLGESYIHWIRTDNFLLLRRSEIKSNLMNDFKKIESVDINFHGLSSIEISVVERDAKYLWCNDTKNCYFMDKTGFIFKNAPILNPNPYFEFFGLIAGDPVGQSYLSGKFFDINNFLDTLGKMGFNPKSFTAIDSHKYGITLSTGANIILDDKKTFQTDIIDLQAIIDNGYVNLGDKSFQKIKTIFCRAYRLGP